MVNYSKIIHSKIIRNYKLECYFRVLIGLGYLVLQTKNIPKAFLISDTFFLVQGKFLTASTRKNLFDAIRKHYK